MALMQVVGDTMSPRRPGPGLVCEPHRVCLTETQCRLVEVKIRGVQHPSVQKTLSLLSALARAPAGGRPPNLPGPQPYEIQLGLGAWDPWAASAHPGPWPSSVGADHHPPELDPCCSSRCS